eukprot:CAMPEP_0116118160 /NCGR_PEP_ID=MMETSP0329-20121206/1957_1 /TAXON_ID=697910 /ORGANISM="Pseudo-nitzschia arenysensis, Strain B593" /LENGTH=1286 /DNA_ID=CAMNT_0003611771 /DNA_START=219 /DNA_END=4079 /DNA_ORIENTATION=+
MATIADSNAEANGFLVLDHCDIYLGTERGDECLKEEPTVDPWFDIEIPALQVPPENLVAQTQRNDTSNGGLNTDSSANANVDRCPNTNLILIKNSSFVETKHLRVVGSKGSNGPRYDGTIRDMKCQGGDGKQRSDAALMLGLALLSQDLGHIAIRSIKVGIYNIGNMEANQATAIGHSFRSCGTSTESTLRENNYRYQKAKACLMITFWCQEVTNHSLPNERRRFFQYVTKQLLHPATQLIISIMSSDWNEYDAKIYELSSLSPVEKKNHYVEAVADDNNGINTDTDRIHRVRQRIPSLSFFPSKMNLEDVFLRISGVSTSLLLSNPDFDPEETKKEEFLGKRHNNTNRNMKSEDQYNLKIYKADDAIKKITIATLPGDILCHRIGQYLRAKSLDSLRCTCKHLHWTLRAVVPGLKLRLYSHQIKSLMWMRGRESKLLDEDDLLHGMRCRHRQKQGPNQIQNMTQWIKNTPDGDIHRAATGGGTVVLSSRRQLREKDKTRFESYVDQVRISQFDHSEVLQRRTYIDSSSCVSSSKDRINPLARKVARGGLLCDDPGLGKTITVISLILQTMGLTTKKMDDDITNKGNRKRGETVEGNSRRCENTIDGESTGSLAKEELGNELSPDNEQIFYEYWKEQIVPEFRCKALTKLFSTFLRCSREINYFFDNYWIKELRAKNISAPSEPQVSLKNIRRRIDRSVYGDSLEGFVLDVESCFDNAISNHLVSDLIRQAAERLKTIFRSEINAFKKSQIDIAIKSFSRASAKPDSVVAALIQKNNTEQLRKKLLPSSSTLMVVPAVLVDHWMEQIRLNVNLSYCTAKIPVVFQYTGSIKSNDRIKETKLKCLVQKTHFPLVFVDRTATKKLPPPSFLAMFKIVLTTNNRFSSEWKNGSFEDEIRRNRNRDNRSEGYGRMSDFREDLATSEEACSLLKVNWLRMIVDEGHSMGRGRDSSSISFASWVNAERRWAMTGTPTPQISSQSGLMNVLNLMQYLKHDFFTRRHGGDITWNKLIVKSWNIGHVSAFFRLRSLLSMLMIRHVKSDITELPLPTFTTNTLSMGFEEITTYNTLVCAIQSNLTITSMKGKTSGAQDSLLHKSQSRHAREALSNLRLVCAGGTQVRPTLSKEYWIEFHQDFDDCNADLVQRKKIRDFISRATTGQQSKCDCCSLVLSTLLVFPCGHLVCTECVDSDTTSCVVCEKAFDVDAFQRLQPGFKYDWLHNVEEEMKQQSMDNDTGAQDAHEVSVLPGGSGLLVPQNQRPRRARTRRFGDGHTCEYDPKKFKWPMHSMLY